MKPTPKELKLLLDYTNYIKECVSTKSEISKKTIKDYLSEDHFYNNIFNEKYKKRLASKRLPEVSKTITN